jgi:hypothetical protein
MFIQNAALTHLYRGRRERFTVEIRDLLSLPTVGERFILQISLFSTCFLCIPKLDAGRSIVVKVLYIKVFFYINL